MKKRLNKRHYIYANIVWTVICTLIYRIVCFSCISTNILSIHLSDSNSKVIFYLLMIILTAVYVAINYRTRQITDVISNPLYPLAVYTIVSKLDYYKAFAIWILSIVFWAVALVILIKALFKPNKHFNITIMLKRLRMQIKHSKFIRNYGRVILMLILIVVPLFGGAAMNKSAETASNIDMNSFNVLNHLDELYDFKSDIWDENDLDSRLKAIKSAADINLTELGVHYSVDIDIAELDEDILGLYNDNNHSIRLNKEYLEDCTNREALELICHECYHSYQHSLIESYDSVDDNYKNLIIYKDVETYKSELMNYDELSEDFYTYYDLEIECDARNYAENKADVYLFLIGEESKNAVVVG